MNRYIEYMEWKTLDKTESSLASSSEWNSKHSTPLSFRPAPTASPNSSKILTDIEEEILQLAQKIH